MYRLKYRITHTQFLVKPFIWAFLLLIIAACAKVGMPSGGPKDKTAPKLVKAEPANKSTNFQGNKITITFDEFIQVDNIAQNLLISPPLEKTPTIVASGNKIKIKFDKNQLKDSTNYSFFFGNSIKDNNEGNVFQSFTYAFSTGNTIDTMRISGTVTDVLTHLPIDGAYVMLYTNLSDTAPKTQLPIFITKTNKSGVFQIENIKKANYRLYALKDANNDMKFNQPKEAFAFYDSIITPRASIQEVTDTIKCPKKDSTIKQNTKPLKVEKPCKDSVFKKMGVVFEPKNINLECFVEQKLTQFLSNYSRERKEKVEFDFNQALINDSLVIEPLNISVNNSQFKIEKNTTKDTVIYWILDKSLMNNDSIKFVLHYFKHDSTETLKWLTDTIKPRYEKHIDKQKGNLACYLLNTIKNNTELDLKSPLSWTVSTPIKSFDVSKIKLFEAVDTNSIQTTKDEFYQRDTANKEIYSTFSLPRMKKYKSKYPVAIQTVKNYQTGRNKFRFSFEKPLLESDSIELKLQDRNQSSWLITERDLESNSLFCWITDKALLNQKSFTFQVLFNGKTIDTLEFIKPKIGTILNSNEARELIIPPLQLNSLRLDEMIPVYMINPIDSFNTKGFKLVKTGDTSSTPIAIECKRFKAYPRTLFICASKLKKAQNYTLTIDDYSVTDIRGNRNIEQTFTIKTQVFKNNYILTPVKSYTVKTDSLSPRKQNIIYKWAEKKKYQLTVLPEAITDIYGNTNDSLQLVFSIPSKENIGTLLLTMKGITSDPVIIQIWDKEEKSIIDWKYTTEDSKVTFNYLKAGDYKLKLVYDKNKNKKWDTGTFLKSIQPEKTQYYTSTISIKAGWDNAIEWNILEAPKSQVETTTPSNQPNDKKAK